MTNKEFSNGWQILSNSGLRFKQEPTKLMGQIWFNSLKDIDEDVWFDIIKYWIANNKDFPTICDILDTKEKINKMGFDIYREIERCDFGRNYVDPLLDKAVKRCGGFYRLGQCSESEARFMIKDIEKEYKEVLKEDRYMKVKHITKGE